MLMQPPPVGAYTTPSTTQGSQVLPNLGSPVQQARMQRMYHPQLNAGFSSSMPALSQNPLQPQMMAGALQQQGRMM